MKFLTLFHLANPCPALFALRPALYALIFALCALPFGLSACGGEVVRVTKVQRGENLNGLKNDLKEKDRAILEEIKKGKDKKKIDSGITTVIEKTPHIPYPNIWPNTPKRGVLQPITRWGETTS